MFEGAKINLFINFSVIKLFTPEKMYTIIIDKSVAQEDNT